MSDFLRDREVVNYELPVLAGPNAEELEAALEDPQTRWYGLKKLAQFERLGLVAASTWNPLLHPRGPDGKFINKFGWVRALINGKWERGYVKDIAADGRVTVEFKQTQQTRTYTNFDAGRSLYALPKPKAHLDLPQLGKKHPKWSQTGGQGGSNPGAKFKLHDETSVSLFTESRVDAALKRKIDGPVPSLIIDPDGDPDVSKLPKHGFILQYAGEGAGLRVFKVTRNETGAPVITDLSTGEPGVVGDGFDWPMSNGEIYEVFGDSDLEASTTVERYANLIVDTLDSKPVSGDEVYVKKSKSLNHARNEVLANRLYELAGVPIPEVHFGEDPQYVGSKILTGEIQPLSSAFSSDELMSEIRSNMVIDAWLANWDVAGLTYDNIVIVDGVPTRIDAGGSLLYRAQGGPKGKFFGGEVTELKTLRDPSMNPQSAKVFGGATDAELRAGAAKVAAIHPDTIRAYVEEAGMDDSLANTLIARRANVIEELLGGVDPYAPPAAPEVKSPDKSDLDDDVLLSLAQTLIENGKYEGSNIQKEVNLRGLTAEAQALEDDAASLEADGVDPKFKAVLPDTSVPIGAEQMSDVELVVNRGQSKGDDWIWDPKSKVWYRGKKKAADATELHLLTNDYRDTIAGLPPFNGKPGDADPTDVTDLFDVNGEVKSEHVGRWLWLGGAMWEITGTGEKHPDTGVPTIRLVHLGSGQETSLPHPSHFENPAVLAQYEYQTKGFDAIFGVGYLVDPGDDREGFRLLSEELYAAQVNQTFGGSNAQRVLEQMSTSPQLDADTAYDNAAKTHFTVKAEWDGFLLTSPPPSLEGATVSSYSFATEYDPDRLEIAAPIVGATHEVDKKDLANQVPGTILQLRSQSTYQPTIVQVQSDGRWKVLLTPRYKSYVLIPNANEGDIVEPSALVIEKLTFAGRAPKIIEEFYLAHTERARILNDAKAKLDAALEVELDKSTAALLTPDDILALDDDLPMPASVRAYSDAMVARHELANTPTKAIDPNTSPLKFVGAVKTQDLYEGMWIIADPGGHPTTVNSKPLKVTQVKKVDPSDENLVTHVVVTDLAGNSTQVAISGLASLAPGGTPTVMRIAPPAAAVSSPTLKKTGEVVVDGLVVGKWEAGYDGYRNVTIFSQFHPSGRDSSVNGRASKIKETLRPVVILPKDHINSVIAKSEKAKKAASEIKWKVGKLADGSRVQPGLQVRNVVTGSDGVLVGSIHPSRDDMVYVRFEDGRIEVLDTVNLISIGKPVSSTQKPSSTPATPKPTVDVPKDLPPAVVEAMEKTPANFVMADGSAPLVGMKVEAGKGAKVVTGHVQLINKDGYMRVLDEDGKLHWRSIKVAKALEAPSYADEPAVAATLATSQPDLPDIAPPAPVDPDTPAPSLELAGVKFLQSREHVEKHTETGGQLTFDGFVPDVGLPVIDRQGNRLVVAAQLKDKNAVAVYDPADPTKLKTRKVANLTTDIASYGGEHGAISEVKIGFNGKVISPPAGVPAGSSVYYVETVTHGASSRGNAHVVIVSPSGRTWETALTSDYTGGKYQQVPKWTQTHGGSKSFFGGTYAGGNIRKLGVYSGADGDGTHVLFQPGVSHYKNPVEPVLTASPDPVSSESFFEVIAAVKAAEAPKVIGLSGEEIAPQQVLDLPDGVFPKPANAPDRNPDSVKPVPKITGGSVDFSEPVPVSGAMTVKGAAQAVIDARESTEANSGVRYALIDEDYIEDALVRFQVVRDASGNEFVEARFRLQEEQSEAVSDMLLSSSDVEYGGWTQSNTVYPTDLVEGDYIAVYKSNLTDALKPLEESTDANARVTGPPELIGRSDASGFDVYRVPVVLHTGEAAVVDIELRESTSVAVISWDPDMEIAIGGKDSKYTVSSGAAADGWSAVGNGVFTPFTQSSKVSAHLSESGVAKLPSDVGHGGISKNGGRTLTRTLADGTVVRFTAVPSTSAGGTGHGSARRTEMARDVRVRVPVDSADLDTSLSHALQVVGVPVEKQQPPTKEALARLALNKLNKHFSTSFKHREKAVGPDDDVSPESSTVTSLLANASKRLNLTGDEALTPADIEIAVSADGRVTPQLSKRAAQAVTKRQGNVYYRHSIGYGNDVEIITSIFGNPASTGLHSSDERWSLGVTTTGQSTHTDMVNGAGDRVYMTGMKSSTISGKIIMSATAINRTLDGYVNGGDGWGKRKADNNFVIQGDAYEYMIKRRVDPEQIAYVVVDSGDRKKILDELKKRGVTHVGGRPIEQIIVSEKPKVDADFQDIGSDVHTVGATLNDLLGVQSAGSLPPVGGPAAGGTPA